MLSEDTRRDGLDKGCAEVNICGKGHTNIKKETLEKSLMLKPSTQMCPPLLYPNTETHETSQMSNLHLSR